MNWSAIVALSCGTGAILTSLWFGWPMEPLPGTLIGGPWGSLQPLDASRIPWVLGLTLCLLLLTYGWAAVRQGLLGGARRFLAPEGAPPWLAADYARAVRIANSGSIYALLLGGVGSVLEFLGLLAKLNNPLVVWTHTADLLLAMLHAILICLFMFVPLALHLRTQHDLLADVPSAIETDGMLGWALLIFGLSWVALVGCIVLLWCFVYANPPYAL